MRKKENDIIKKEEIRRLIEEISPEIKKINKMEKLEAESKYYKEFKEVELRKKKSIYEVLCNFSEFLNLEPDEEMKKNIQKAIDFAHLNVTPKGVFSFAILAGVSLMIFSAILAVLGVGIAISILMFSFSIVLMFALIKYPEFLADNFRIKVSQEIILAIIYMVIYMRISPQMEGAVRFAAKNLSGPLAYDLRKILWDVETRKYENIFEALKDYLSKWEKNKEFIEAIELMKASLEQPDVKRYQMLDEAINVILSGTEEEMRHYSQSLRTPITIIYALGITLPILVLVMFPIIILMLHETINPFLLIVGYDVILPLMIFFISYEVLRRRPIGYSTPDISSHPRYSPIGKLKVLIFGKLREISLWPIGVAVGLPIIFLGLFVMFSDPSPVGFVNLLGSIIFVWGIGLGFTTVFLFECKKKISMRNQIKKIQDEFAEVLFQLGNRLALGNPMEKAMEQTIKKAPTLTISEMFRKALKNMKTKGLSLEAAFFDRELGAVWEYPSKLIVSVMKIILESVKKSVKEASISAISISRYIKQMHRIEEDLRSMLSESTSSMRVLGMFVAPLISGVTVTMTAVMMMIFRSLKELMGTIDLSRVGGMGFGMDTLFIGTWGEIGDIITLGVFQIIVGIYMIEVSYLLAYLISGIEYGQGDALGRRELAGWNILIGLFVYTITIVVTYFIFVPMVGVLVKPTG